MRSRKRLGHKIKVRKRNAEREGGQKDLSVYETLSFSLVQNAMPTGHMFYVFVEA